ncbi:CPBP family glutamic-type intramembrane protease [Streptomyces sioyaensis]|uniref:CPBP family glutamic-type intramembrane protease n=1 Tax=Streptomyces sioyaensis TaxID=67364 RepID=UPI003EC0FE00
MSLLAAAPALTISSTTAYSAYVSPISPYASTLLDYYARSVSITVAAGWLFWLVFTAGQRQDGARKLSPAVRWAGHAVAVAAVLLNRADPTSNWWGLRNLAAAALFGALTLALMRWCGGSREQLGIFPPGVSTARGRAQAVSVGATVGLAALITIVIVNALPTFLPGTGSAYGGSQAGFLGWKNIWLQAANVVVTGAIEDVVMVGAIVSLLAMARRPAWEMYALSLTIEVGMHLYFGVPAVGISLVAAVSLALYRHTGRLTPIVIAHIAYDLCNGLPVPAWALGLLLAATAFIAALVTGVIGAVPKTDVHDEKATQSKVEAA